MVLIGCNSVIINISLLLFFIIWHLQVLHNFYILLICMILSLLSNFVNVCNSNDQFSFHERDPSNWILLFFRQSFHLRCPTFHPEASTEAFGCSEAAVGSVTEEGKGSNVARPRKASCRILKQKCLIR